MITALFITAFTISAAWGQVGSLGREEGCIPYKKFLDGNKLSPELIQSSENCDDYQRLILGSDDWAEFLRVHVARTSAVHYPTQLQYAFEARGRRDKTSAIERLDRAINGVVVVFEMIDDPDRSILYTSLITWERHRTLTELGNVDDDASKLYENNPYAHEKLRKIWPDDPETALVCLIMADDLFVDLYQVLNSRAVSECFSK